MVTVNELRDALARSPVLGLDLNGPTAPAAADVLALLVCDPLLKALTRFSDRDVSHKGQMSLGAGLLPEACGVWRAQCADRWTNDILFPQPGGPIISMLCPPAAATSIARRARC